MTNIPIVNINTKIFLTSLCVILIACNPTPTEESIRRDIKSFMDKENVPSISIAVVKGNKIAWEASFGYSDVEKQIKATPNTMYNLASISKIYTSSCVMSLVEKDLIGLDEPIQGYLNDVQIKAFNTYVSGVTARRILQHTSGLPMYWETLTERDKQFMRPTNETYNRYSILAFEPGERFIYSNLGIGLLHYSIEQILDQAYPDFMEQEVFQPLALYETKVITKELELPNIARQYDASGNLFSDEKPIAPTVYSSTSDMARFAMFHLKKPSSESKPIFSDSLVDVMQNEIEPLSNYGLCWSVDSFMGWKSLEFSGASGVHLKLIPDIDVAVIVLSNRMLAYVNPITDKICEMMIKKDTNRNEHEYFPPPQRKYPANLTNDSLIGLWDGYILSDNDTMSIQMLFEKDKSGKMRQFIDSEWDSWVETMPASKGSFANGLYSAYFPIEIIHQDTKRRSHWTWVNITSQGEKLKGYAIAHAGGGPYFGLPFYIELSRNVGN